MSFLLYKVWYDLIKIVMISNDNETSLMNEVRETVVKEATEEINRKEKRIRELKDTSIYKVPKTLKEKGYRYDDEALYCPLHTNFKDFYLRISRGFNAYEYCIGLFDENDDFTVFSSSFDDKKPITSSNKSRNQLLGKSIPKINAKFSIYENGEKIVPFDKDYLVDSLEEIAIDLINVKDFPQVNENFKVYEEKEAEEIAEETSEEKGLSFSDYSESIQSEALKLVEQNHLYDNIKRTVSLTHEGDEDLVFSLILIGVSIYIGEPIHSFIGGETGKGKTDLIKTVFKNFPRHHIFEIEEFSPKWIFYNHENFNADYNILLIDDIDLTNSSIVEILKRLTDNSKKVKKLNTVYEQKALNIELKAKFLVILTNAKGNSDSELSNRLYDINILQDEEKEKAIKEKIKKNVLLKSNDDKYIGLLNQYNQCAIQYLNEKEVKVFNPYSIFFNVQFLNNRHISSFYNLVDSFSYLNFSQREIVSMYGIDYVIGTEEDISEVYSRWDIELQSTDLNARQQSILNLDLPILTLEEAYDKQEKDYAEFMSNDSQAWREDFKSKLWNRDRIAKELDCSKNTLKFDLDTPQKDRNTKNLYEMGMIARYRFEPSKDGEDNPRSMWIYYIPKGKNEGEASKLKNSYWYIGTFEMYQSNKPLESKMSILVSFLSLVQILINNTKENFVHSYSGYADDIKSYEDMCNFLNDFAIQFSKDYHREDDEEISIEEVLLHTKKVEFFSVLDTKDFVPTSENEGKSSNAPMEKNLLVHSESTNCTNTEIENEGKSSNINMTMYDVIPLYLELGNDMTMYELKQNIANAFNLDINSEEFEVKNLQIEATVSKMISDGKIIKKSDGFSYKLHLVED